jgi:hypothetical protein
MAYEVGTLTRDTDRTGRSAGGGRKL